jgi:hypothetical protein
MASSVMPLLTIISTLFVLYHPVLMQSELSSVPTTLSTTTKSTSTTSTAPPSPASEASGLEDASSPTTQKPAEEIVTAAADRPTNSMPTEDEATSMPKCTTIRMDLATLSDTYDIDLDTTLDKVAPDNKFQKVGPYYFLGFETLSNYDTAVFTCLSRQAIMPEVTKMSLQPIHEFLQVDSSSDENKLTFWTAPEFLLNTNTYVYPSGRQVPKNIGTKRLDTPIQRLAGSHCLVFNPTTDKFKQVTCTQRHKILCQLPRETAVAQSRKVLRNSLLKYMNVTTTLTAMKTILNEWNSIADNKSTPQIPVTTCKQEKTFSNYLNLLKPAVSKSQITSFDLLHDVLPLWRHDHDILVKWSTTSALKRLFNFQRCTRHLMVACEKEITPSEQKCCLQETPVAPPEDDIFYRFSLIDIILTIILFVGTIHAIWNDFSQRNKEQLPKINIRIDKDANSEETQGVHMVHFAPNHSIHSLSSSSSSDTHSPRSMPDI